MRKVIQQLGIYKKDTYRCIGLTALEVIMEILMPFITAIIIDQGLEAKDLGVVYRFGGMMVVMAFLSLTFGATGRKECGKRGLRAGGQSYGRPSTPISRPFPFPILTNSACQVW